MAYNFKRYTDYMAKNGIDAIIATNYEITARMLNDYFKDLGLLSKGCREYDRYVGCDSKGEMISVTGGINPVVEGTGSPLFEAVVLNLVDELKKRDLDRATIGLELLDFPGRGLLMMQDAMPNATFVDASWLIRQDMAVKTEREQRWIAKSVEICEAGFRNVMKHMRESIGRPVSDLIYHYFAPEVNRLGGEMVGTNLTSRPWEWYKSEDGDPEKATRTEQLVTEGGTPINFDLLCGYQELMCDIAFRGLPGEPDPKFVELWDTSVIVKDVLVETVKAGMTSAEAEAACLEAMEKAVGNAYDGQYWAVHSVGLHIHEFPQIGSPYKSLAGEYVFEPGMVVSVESIAEQAFVIEENGMRRLGEMPMEIYKA
ncbi:MAG: M24 family metallopeptidase [Armatimonadota bacterium]|nr:M24 family metallopeptidase [Armatimonadota bacterium]